MENEIPSINRVDTIREELTALQGERLKVRANMGRSRIVERTGTLLMAHPSLFVIEVEERRGRRSRQSYQYVDVLTGTVELYDTDTGERILDFTPEDEQGFSMLDDGDDLDDED
jgi:uncharacterized protein Veg